MVYGIHKHFARLVAILFLLGVFSSIAFAEETTLPNGEEMTAPAEALYYDESLPRVVDGANLLTQQEEQVLDGKCREIAEQYKADIVIVTVDDTDYRSAEEYADDYYDYNGYGVGEYRSGMLLLLSMEEREWHISTTGYCIDCIDVYDLSEYFLPCFAEDNYYDGFEAFLISAENRLSIFDIEHENDGDSENKWIYEDEYWNKDFGNNNHVANSFSLGKPTQFLICLAVAAAIAGIVVAILCSRMKNVRLQANSDRYAVDGGIILTERRDVFLHSTITKHAKPENNSNQMRSGGTPSVHVGSSGTSHGGGGGHF